MPARTRVRRPSSMARLAILLSLTAVVQVAAPGRALAAIAFVKNIGTASSITTDTSVSITVPAAGVAGGNTVVVTFAMDPTSGTVSVSDSKGNAYGAAKADGTNGASTSGVRTLIFAATIGTALVSGDTITISYPLTAAKAASAFEFSGFINAALDRNSVFGEINTTTTSQASGTTNTAAELLIGATGAEVRLAAEPTWNATNSFTHPNPGDATADNNGI